MFTFTYAKLMLGLALVVTLTDLASLVSAQTSPKTETDKQGKRTASQITTPENLPNTVTLDNFSGMDAIIELLGTSTATVRVPNGQTVTVHVAAGVYTILVRYGNRATEYVYAKAQPFAVTETPTQHSNVKITLPKSPRDDKAARTEFEEREENKRAEQTRLEELRLKLNLKAEAQQDLKPDLNIVEARQRLVVLRRRRGAIQARLDDEYKEHREVLKIPKTLFETTSEYEERRAKQGAETVLLEERYGKELAALTETYDSQISEILSRRFVAKGVKVELLDYDADHELLSATFRGLATVFDSKSAIRAKAEAIWPDLRSSRLRTIPPALPSVLDHGTDRPKTIHTSDGRIAEVPRVGVTVRPWQFTVKREVARSLYDHKEKLEVEGNFLEAEFSAGFDNLELVIHDPVTDARATGISFH